MSGEYVPHSARYPCAAHGQAHAEQPSLSQRSSRRGFNWQAAALPRLRRLLLAWLTPMPAYMPLTPDSRITSSAVLMKERGAVCSCMRWRTTSHGFHSTTAAHSAKNPAAICTREELADGTCQTRHVAPHSERGAAGCHQSLGRRLGRGRLRTASEMRILAAS